MKAKIFAELEKDIDFKKDYLKSTNWWLNFSFVPPVLVLFAGLIGIMYLFNQEKLVSYYTIPYVLLFMLGTVWLKAVRRYVQKAAINTEGAFQICIAKVVGEYEGYIYSVFANNSRRHDKHYIENVTRHLDVDTLMQQYKKEAKKKSIAIENEAGDTGLYLRAYFNNNITKRYPLWKEEKLFPVLFINPKDTPIVKNKHLLMME